MNRPSFDLLSSSRSSQGQAVLVGKIMLVLMMATVAIGITQAGERLAPNWRGQYLVWIVLLVSIESIVTRSHAKELESRDRLIFHLSEWVAFAVAIKITIYLAHGPAQILTDIPLWQANFLENFFTGEYVLALFISALIWFNSSGCAGDLESLYDRDLDTRWDELGKLQNALNDVRRRIIGRIFVVGTLIVLLAVISRLDATAIFRSMGKPPPGYFAPVLNVLVYFLLALVMLSQTQFALLRIRWLWQKLPISSGLAGNWIKYSLLFFLALTIIIFFLPTEYSLNLLDTLRVLLNFLIQALSYLLVIILFPITLCLSLFRTTAPQNTQAPPPETPPMFPPAGPGQQPVAWLEFLRSLAFWIIFLGVIIFALRFYLMQNAALWNAITRFPLFGWISAAWGSFWKWVKGANRQLAGLVQEGIKRIRAQRMVTPAQAIRRVFNFSRLNPREKIIYFYLTLIELGRERGLERKPAQTPYQYEHHLSDTIPEIDPDLRSLTDTFLEARYSQHPIEQPNADQANSLWEHIKAILKEWKRED